MSTDDSNRHFVHAAPLRPPFPDSMSLAVFGMGCFWGAERLFWECEGVFSTSVGYAGGRTPNPDYREVCAGGSGHVEVVQVVFDQRRVDYQTMLRVFWEGHDPTQGMRQGNDVGEQYRSVIFLCAAPQRAPAEASLDAYQRVLTQAGFGGITTTIEELSVFHYAEDEHQQYLAKHPGGYCGLGGTGLKCPPPSV